MKTPQEITRALTLFAEHGIRTHTYDKPMKTLELHNPMIQILVYDGSTNQIAAFALVYE